VLASHSFSSWVGALQGVCGRFEARPARNPALFIGEVGMQDYAGLEVAQIRTNAGLISRQSTKADHEDDRYCFLIIQRSGHARLSQGAKASNWPRGTWPCWIPPAPAKLFPMA